MMNTDQCPPIEEFADAICCGINDRHTTYNSDASCHRCIRAKMYVGATGIYGIGMTRFNMYMRCQICKRRTPIPCEEHAEMAAKLGCLTDQQLNKVLKIHALFC
jgi:hypothetical protein